MDFKEALTKHNSSFDLLFGKPEEIEFLEKEFDFKLDPGHFIEWLAKEGEDITGEYARDVSSMCEFSCLYTAMMLKDRKLKGELRIHYGSFGFFEHYWMGYTYEGREYFIDLTLQQFCKSAPKLAVSLASNKKAAGSYHSHDARGQGIKEYLKRNKAFRRHTNPFTMVTPPKPVDAFRRLIDPVQEIMITLE